MKIKETTYNSNLALSVRKKQDVKNKLPNIKKINRNSIGQTAYFCDFPFMGNKQKISRVRILNGIKEENLISDEGFKGRVYKINEGEESYAVKVARSREFDFSKEAEVLKKIPPQMEGSQNFIDYFKDPKIDSDILVTTFVRGKTAVMKEKEDFQNFLKSFLSWMRLKFCMVI